MKKHFKLSDYAITYSTRAKGDEIANTLKEYIKTLSDYDHLVVDFDGVEAISYSFLDQFLSKVSECDLLKNREISIAGWSENLLSVIDKSLQHRNCQYSELKSERRLVCHTN
jgi:hypothetical protein